MGAVGFIDTRVSVLSGYYKGSVGLPTKLLVMEIDGKVTS
jgi:hypothetical protein